MLRDYQQEAVDTLKDWWSKTSRPAMLQLATGAGKSHIIAAIAEACGNQNVLILQPSKEILEQNLEKIVQAGVPREWVAVCSASAGDWKIGTGITLATIGTIAKYAIDYCQHIKTIIVDEADVVPNDKVTSQYMQFFNNIPRARVVGLTATPWRNQTYHQQFCDPRVHCRPVTRIPTLGKKEEMADAHYGTWFWGGVIYKCPISRLQKLGFLSPTKYYVAETDWSFVNDVPGRVEYEMDQMSKWADIDENTAMFTRAVKWCMDNNLKTIMFSPNIDMNFRLVNVIRALGGTAECMDSEHDNRKSRSKKMEDFRAGKFQFLVNVGMVGRGVDVPSVDCVFECRPTKSLSFYMQMIGRCLRIDPDNPDKIAYIVDLTENFNRFGRVEDVRLEKQTKEDRAGNMRQTDVIVLSKGGKSVIWDRVS